MHIDRRQGTALLAALEAGADEDRRARVAAAVLPPQPWQGIDEVPMDGMLLDVKFDPWTADIDGSGKNMAEFYVPGSTRRLDPAEPIIENVAYVNGGFKPVVDWDAAEAVRALAGRWGHVDGVLYGIMSVRLTHWRPAAYPPIPRK